MYKLTYKESISTRLSRSLLHGLVIYAGLWGSAQASAAVINSSSTAVEYQYQFVDPANGNTSGAAGTGNIGQFDINGPFSKPSNVKIDYFSLVNDGGGFSFLSNVQCTGFCSARVDTFVQTSITNLGQAPVFLRYDAQITPGHLGYQGHEPETFAAFSARIFEGNDPSPSNTLYDLAGEISGLTNGLSGSGLPLDGLTFSQSGEQRAFDWNATDFSLLLRPVMPGETRLITILAWAAVRSAGRCDSLLVACEGAQAVFGDPRNDGGGTNSRVSGLAPSSLAIGRVFSPFVSYIHVVDANAPLPGSAVPEPMTWALMVMGFAAAGAALRGRPKPGYAA